MVLALPSVSLTGAGRFASSGNVALHVHDGLELVYVARGHCACEAGAATVEGFEGDLLVLPDRVPHTQVTFEETETVYVAVRGFEGIVSDRPRTIKVSDRRPIRWLEDLAGARSGIAPLSPACQAALALALLQAVRHLEDEAVAYHPAVARALDCMRERLHEPALSLADVASAGRVSVSHLSLLFRNEMKRSPMHVLTELRLQRAMQMLSDPYASVKTISATCGFSDASYFCRVFRRHSGASPREYRASQSVGA